MKDVTPDQVLTACSSWRVKYHLGEGIEIYHGVDVYVNPYLADAIMFYEGFLRDGICFPFSPLAVSLFNYFERVPQ